MTRSRWVKFIVATMFIVSAALFGVVSTAKADTYPWYNCSVQFETTYAAYYYPAGGYWVAAGPWHEYGTEANPNCNDINVEIWNTGNIIVRTQVCPYDGNPCYVVQPGDGWGGLYTWGPTYGVTLHGAHLPCGGNCAARFRIETKHGSYPSGVAENMRLAF